MPEVAFVMPRDQGYPLRELAETLGHELDLQAVPSALHVGGFPEPRPGLVYVLMDPKAYVAREGEQALPGDGILRRTIFLADEPPPTAADDDHIALLRRAGAVFAVDPRSVAAMHRLGIPARLVRAGYSKSLDHFDASATRPIDVMFLGRRSPRRTKYLARAARVLSRHNCLLQVADDTPSTGDTSSYLGPGRWPLLARTKVLMSLHHDDDGLRLDWRGTLDAIHAGAVVVTEHSSAIAPLVPGEHLLTASPDALAYVVDDLLRDEQRLARLRSQAYDRLRTWVPYALGVSILRAAIVELVGEPEPFGAARGRVRPVPDSAAAAAGAPTPNGRGPEHRAPTVARSSPAAATIEVARETPAWPARRAPRVSAIVALPGPDPRVLPTLDSLARSRMRDFEVVVVAGGAVEGAHPLVENWISEHPRIAGRLVVTDVGGVGALRNIGLDFARGPACLILDPGQELYPRCLDVLAGTLEAMPEMTFTYPMQEVACAPDGEETLESFLGWDPGRVRERNDIHVPALIRTDCLRQLGGFASGLGDGLEDHDLWCRMADRGWQGQLVPQELAKVQPYSTSMKSPRSVR